MRQPMLRLRMSRHGGHHVNSAALSGSSARATSTSASPSNASKSARSSSRWPMTSGLRSLGCTSMSARAMLMSPHRTGRGLPRAALSPSRRGMQEAELRRIVLAAVGHVHRSEHEVAERDLHDARLHVEVRDARTRALRAARAAGAATRRNSRPRHARTRDSRRACSARAPGRAAP